METYFASPERADQETIQEQIGFIRDNPIITGLMNLTAGLLAVLNEHRQVLEVNQAMVEMLGLEGSDLIIGLRPGEALGCIHGRKDPAGCGTTQFCSNCGAAVAMVAALSQDKPAQRTCAIKTGGESNQDIFLQVKACPLTVDGFRILLLFIQDITEQQRLAALERVFFHDIANLTTGLMNAAEMLSTDLSGNGETSGLMGHINRLSQQIFGEVNLQKQLIQRMDRVYRPLPATLEAGSILRELGDLYAHHPVTRGKKLNLAPDCPKIELEADRIILLRVLGNMVANALEASEPGDEVRIWAERNDDSISFKVWNRTPVRADIVTRMFQRNISTKAGAGRGLGTYSMKLFGEEIMGGKVDFTTSEAEGTTFSLTLPLP